MIPKYSIYTGAVTDSHTYSSKHQIHPRWSTTHVEKIILQIAAIAGFKQRWRQSQNLRTAALKITVVVRLPTGLLIMATSAGNSSVLEEELTCPVCLDLYRDPHLLPCGHNFCLPCLRRLKSRANHGRLRCPECRQTHRSSASWQKNFKLANIADGFRRRGQSERSARSDASHRPAQVRCDYCPEDASEDGRVRWRLKPA